MALAALTAYYVVISWRRWPDPLIDFGNELYRSWRLAQGAVLYRDLDSFYGPLSQVINAKIFALFGPGMMHLVWVNLVVFAMILGTLYWLLRRAWGPGAAFCASAVFISIFGFSQFIRLGNYTYLAPYCHESTHGMLVLLLLLAVLSRWLERPTRLLEFAAGLLFGFCPLLKPEILLAGGTLVVATALLRWQRARQLEAWGIALGGTAAVLPTLVFLGYFSRLLPVNEAWGAACHVWLNPSATITVAKDQLQIGFLGFDQPWGNLLRHLQATVVAVAMIALILIVGRMADRQANRQAAFTIAVIMVAGVVAMAWWMVAWLAIGKCLLGLILLYFFWQLVQFTREENLESVVHRRILFAVLAATLMARMVLNGRIYQFGFYQAAIAGTVVPAVLLGESPTWVRVKRWGRHTIAAGFLGLLLTGVVILSAHSRRLFLLKTHPVGQGVDQFYAFPPGIHPRGEIVRWLSEALSRQSHGQTLLVLPEGLMLNYLSRLPSPLPPFIYFSVATEQGQEARLLDKLQRQPPDLVVLISRDLREYGIQRYGESIGKGQLILQWVSANYTELGRIGEDPLDVHQAGAIVFRKNRP